MLGGRGDVRKEVERGLRIGDDVRQVPYGAVRDCATGGVYESAQSVLHVGVVGPAFEQRPDGPTDAEVLSVLNAGDEFVPQLGGSCDL